MANTTQGYMCGICGRRHEHVALTCLDVAEVEIAHLRAEIAEANGALSEIAESTCEAENERDEVKTDLATANETIGKLRRSVEVYPKATDIVRAAAKTCGYSVGSHGSRLRDLDLIAVPWTPKATSAEDLAVAIGKAIAEADLPGKNDLPQNYKGGPMPNGMVSPPNHNSPHGRVSYSIFLAGSYIDLSVMP